jgi:hypothetical protein
LQVYDITKGFRKSIKEGSESMKATWATGKKRSGGVSKHGRTTKGRKARGKK